MQRRRIKFSIMADEVFKKFREEERAIIMKDLNMRKMEKK